MLLRVPGFLCQFGQIIVAFYPGARQFQFRDAPLRIDLATWDLVASADKPIVFTLELVPF